jgi:hypothetical protein
MSIYLDQAMKELHASGPERRDHAGSGGGMLLSMMLDEIRFSTAVFRLDSVHER